MNIIFDDQQAMDGNSIVNHQSTRQDYHDHPQYCEIEIIFIT